MTEFVPNIQVTILDDNADPVALPAADVRRVLESAINPSDLGPADTEPGGFDGDYLVSLSRSMWDEVLRHGSSEALAVVGGVRYDVVIHAEAR